MTEAICKTCGKLFTALVILGITHCPHCGSQDTCVAKPSVMGGKG